MPDCPIALGQQGELLACLAAGYFKSSRIAERPSGWPKFFAAPAEGMPWRGKDGPRGVTWRLLASPHALLDTSRVTQPAQGERVVYMAFNLHAPAVLKVAINVWSHARKRVWIDGREVQGALAACAEDEDSDEWQAQLTLARGDHPVIIELQGRRSWEWEARVHLRSLTANVALQPTLNLRGDDLVRLLEVQPTAIFLRPEEEPGLGPRAPGQVVKAFMGNFSGHKLVRAEVALVGPGVELGQAKLELGRGELREVEVPVRWKPGNKEGDPQPATLRLTHPGGAVEQSVQGLRVAAADWKIFLVSHFHFDPVWWNTQYGFLEGDRGGALGLIEGYLQACAADPEFKFVLEQMPYTVPYWALYPERRAQLRSLMQAGRLEIVGGMYNQPQTTLTCAESTIRNILYGMVYHRTVWGADPRIGWMLDVFGHDPNFAQFMVKSQHTACTYARGPFKRGWGIAPEQMGMSTDYLWVSPDGSRLLTHLLEPGHYGYGGALRNYRTYPERARCLEHHFATALPFHQAHCMIFTVGSDMTPVIPWLAELAREWNKRYLSPRLIVGTASEYFQALRESLEERRVRLAPQSRELDPVNNGCDVSFEDTKLANRAGECALIEAEKFGTVAALLGADYPYRAVDKAWRHLLFNAHHDALTGSESDQVYVDLLASYREAWELARGAREDALRFVGKHIDTQQREGTPLAVFNSLSWARSDIAVAEVAVAPQGQGVAVEDAEGRAMPAQLLGPLTGADGQTRQRMAFLATDVPAMGYRIFYARIGDPAQASPTVQQTDKATTIENEFYRITVDPARGGGIVSLFDKVNSKELIRSKSHVLGNDLVAHKEYADHPKWGEGPWNISTTGEKYYSHHYSVEVTTEVGPLFSRIIARGPFVECSRVQEVILWQGIPRVDFRTQIVNYKGENWLYKIHFPFAVEDGRPLAEVGNACVGRTYCPGDLDAKIEPSTQDGAVNYWLAVTAPARLVVEDEKGQPAFSRSLAVGEIVYEDGGDPECGPASILAEALAKAAVTTTVSAPHERRYGDLKWDSNLPDFRISLGSPEANAFTRAVLEAAGPKVQRAFTEALEKHGRVVMWAPEVKLHLPCDLPVLLVCGKDQERQTRLADELAAQLTEGVIRLARAAVVGALPRGQVDDTGVVIANRGTLAHCVYPDVTATMALIRSSTGNPSGMWIDEPKRKMPDGSNFEVMHWNHCFEYSLAAFAGDWRASRAPQFGHEVNFPLLALALEPHAGKLPASHSFVAVEPCSAVLTALKPAGLPLADGHAPAKPDASDQGKTALSLVARIYEATGRALDNVTITLPSNANAAHVCDLLEEQCQPVPTDGQRLNISLKPFETATIKAECQLLGSEAGSLGAGAEPRQPVYVRYWRYNKHAAPIGFLPCAVRLDPHAEPCLTSGTAMLFRAVVASNRAEPVRGTVSPVVPEGWGVSVASFHFELDAGGDQTFDFIVDCPDEALAGIYSVRAEVEVGDGQTYCDVCELTVGQPPTARTLRAEWERTHVAVQKGRHERLVLRLENGTPQEIIGEAQLCSPFETWEFLGPYTQTFVVAAGGSAQVAFGFRPPPHAEGGHYWALAKVMWNGRLYYTEAIDLEVL
jgi:alpha-mannosidase